MINVGTVHVEYRREHTGHVVSPECQAQYGWLPDPESDVHHLKPKSRINVWVGCKGVSLGFDHNPGKVMDPEKAIELAQLLMKAAESQTDYAKKRKALQEEMEMLDTAFKDRISGLGIEGIEEPGFKSAGLKSMPFDEYNGLIVETG